MKLGQYSNSSTSVGATNYRFMPLMLLFGWVSGGVFAPPKSGEPGSPLKGASQMDESGIQLAARLNGPPTPSLTIGFSTFPAAQGGVAGLYPQTQAESGAIGDRRSSGASSSSVGMGPSLSAPADLGGAHAETPTTPPATSRRSLSPIGEPGSPEIGAVYGAAAATPQMEPAARGTLLGGPRPAAPDKSPAGTPPSFSPRSDATNGEKIKACEDQAAGLIEQSLAQQALMATQAIALQESHQRQVSKITAEKQELERQIERLTQEVSTARISAIFESTACDRKIQDLEADLRKAKADARDADLRLAAAKQEHEETRAEFDEATARHLRELADMDRRLGEERRASEETHRGYGPLTSKYLAAASGSAPPEELPAQLEGMGTSIDSPRHSETSYALSEHSTPQSHARQTEVQFSQECPVVCGKIQASLIGDTLNLLHTLSTEGPDKAITIQAFASKLCETIDKYTTGPERDRQPLGDALKAYVNYTLSSWSLDPSESTASSSSEPEAELEPVVKAKHALDKLKGERLTDQVWEEKVGSLGLQQETMKTMDVIYRCLFVYETTLQKDQEIAALREDKSRFGLFAMAAEITALKAEKAKLEEEKQALEERVVETPSPLEHLEQQAVEAQADRDRAQTQLQSRTQELERVQAELAQKNRRLEELEATLEAAENANRLQKAQLEKFSKLEDLSEKCIAGLKNLKELFNELAHKALDQAAQAEAECEARIQELEANTEEQIESLQAEQESNWAILAQLNEQLRATEEQSRMQRAEIEQHRLAVSEFQKEAYGLKDEQGGIVEENTGLRRQVARKQLEIQRLEDCSSEMARTMEEARLTIVRFHNQIHTLTSESQVQSSALDRFEEDRVILRDALEMAEAKLETLRAQHALLEKRYNESQEDLASRFKRNANALLAEKGRAQQAMALLEEEIGHLQGQVAGMTANLAVAEYNCRAALDAKAKAEAEKKRLESTLEMTREIAQRSGEELKRLQQSHNLATENVLGLMEQNGSLQGERDCARADAERAKRSLEDRTEQAMRLQCKLDGARQEQRDAVAEREALRGQVSELQEARSILDKHLGIEEAERTPAQQHYQQQINTLKSCLSAMRETVEAQTAVRESILSDAQAEHTRLTRELTQAQQALEAMVGRRQAAAELAQLAEEQAQGREAWFAQRIQEHRSELTRLTALSHQEGFALAEEQLRDAADSLTKLSAQLVAAKEEKTQELKAQREDFVQGYRDAQQRWSDALAEQRAIAREAEAAAEAAQQALAEQTERAEAAEAQATEIQARVNDADNRLVRLTSAGHDSLQAHQTFQKDVQAAIAAANARAARATQEAARATVAAQAARAALAAQRGSGAGNRGGDRGGNRGGMGGDGGIAPSVAPMRPEVRTRVVVQEAPAPKPQANTAETVLRALCLIGTFGAFWWLVARFRVNSAFVSFVPMFPTLK